MHAVRVGRGDVAYCIAGPAEPGGGGGGGGQGGQLPPHFFGR